MTEKYLIINAGSSSLKFSLYKMPEEKEIVNGLVERIGNKNGFYSLKTGAKKIESETTVMNHAEAVALMLHLLLEHKFIDDISDIKGIGHRILHGGEYYSESVAIDDEVLYNIKKLTKLGPLHHPGEIAGIESMRALMPDVTQVAVFDTAFHQTMPEENYMYAVPYEWYQENGVRKYGFHGTSHKYITEVMKDYFHKDQVNLIICHLGSGASISCIKNGKCFDTSMGLTPLDGLIMGTRCGNIDSSIIEYICKERNISVEDVNIALNKRSGLIGLTGKNDYRDVQKLVNEGDKKAILAHKMFLNAVLKYIAQYYFELNGKVDAMIFTAGIGENSVDFRAEIVDLLSNTLNIKLNKEVNDHISRFKEHQSGVITTDDSAFKVMVYPTNEEYMIFKDTLAVSRMIEKNKVKALVR